MIRDVEVRARPGPGRRRNRSEVRLDQILDRGLVEIADRDDGHQIRPVPIGIEFLQPLGLAVLNDLGQTNRNPIRIARAFEQDRKYLILCPGPGAASHPPFFHYDAALLVDFGLIEGNTVRPVLEDQQRLVHYLRLVGWDLEHINRLVKTSVGVQVSSKAHAE